MNNEYEITPEKIFLRYALPCLDTLCYKLHHVTPEKKQEIENRFEKNGDIPKEELENIFPAAFRRLKNLFKENYWIIENIKTYFIDKHNDFIDKADGKYSEATESIKYWCKVRIATVEEIKENKIIIISYEDHNAEFDSTRRFLNNYGLRLEPGDKVTTHWRCIIEKLD